jgi:nicotinate phosphoribosyltransferase
MKGITPFPDAPAGSNITALATEVNKKKAEALAAIGAFYSEFGTRRRYSSENQDKVIGDMKQYGKGNMLGTSNVYYAKKHNLMSMGTVAHEWYMMHAALFGYTMANQIASEAWVDVYEGNLGIALPDTFTTDVFLRTFSTKHAKLFDGLRQDSYDPIVFLEKIITHYKNLKINPTHKIGFFSDNLNSIEKVQRIRNATKDRIIDRYGFGTWMTNDLGVKPLNMVIKLMAVNNGGGWVNTVKLSDDPMKNTGNRDTIDLCKQTLKIK